MYKDSFYDSAARKIVYAKWLIVGHDNYCFAGNKKLYNRTTGFEVRQVVKGGYTRGYNLSGRFYSLKKLRLLLYIL